MQVIIKNFFCVVHTTNKHVVYKKAIFFAGYYLKYLQTNIYYAQKACNATVPLWLGNGIEALKYIMPLETDNLYDIIIGATLAS